MPRMTDWQRDSHDAVRREAWSFKGPNQIVKIQPSGWGVASQLGEYITLGKFLLGKTPQQIEKAPWTTAWFLLNGARIYRFSRLPLVEEYEYELTALHPGGLAYNPAHSDPAYPPGHQAIHQWKIKPGTKIPVDSSNSLDLKPGQRFRYDWLLA